MKKVTIEIGFQSKRSPPDQRVSGTPRRSTLATRSGSLLSTDKVPAEVGRPAFSVVVRDRSDVRRERTSRSEKRLVERPACLTLRGVRLGGCSM